MVNCADGGTLPSGGRVGSVAFSREVDNRLLRRVLCPFRSIYEVNTWLKLFVRLIDRPVPDRCSGI